MRNRIFGAIGVIWGGLVLFNALASGGPAPGGNAAYSAGKFVGVALGALLFVAGLYYLIKGDGGPKQKRKKPKNPIRTPI